MVIKEEEFQARISRLKEEKSILEKLAQVARARQVFFEEGESSPLLELCHTLSKKCTRFVVQ